MKPPSKRFQPSPWMEKLVPIFMILLLLGLLATLILVGLAVFGLVPAA